MSKKNSFIQEFQKFIMRGNVIDMAVGVIIGGAFQKIISSLVDDIIMPLIGRLTGGINFTEWFIALDGKEYASLAQAEEAGAALLKYGTFITVVINFLLMAFVIFCLIKVLNRISVKFEKKEEPAAPTVKTCPYCLSEIPVGATRCPHCTSEV